MNRSTQDNRIMIHEHNKLRTGFHRLQCIYYSKLDVAS